MKQQQVVSSHSYRRITTGKHKEDYDEKEKEENVQFLQVSIWYPAASGCEDAVERDVLVVAKSKKSALKKAKKYIRDMEAYGVEDEAPSRIEVEKLHGIPMK